MMGLFDVHAHLTSPRLREDESAIGPARAFRGHHDHLEWSQPGDNEATLTVAARHPDLVRPALGLYPVDAVLEMLAMGVEYHRDEEEPPPDGTRGHRLARSERGTRLRRGEVGLDPAGAGRPLGAAGRRFRRIIRLAMAADKALIIHTRKAERRAFEVLQEEGAERVVWHCTVQGETRHADRPSWPLAVDSANVRKSWELQAADQCRGTRSFGADTYLTPVSGTLMSRPRLAAAFAAERWDEPRTRSNGNCGTTSIRSSGSRPEVSRCPRLVPDDRIE